MDLLYFKLFQIKFDIYKVHTITICKDIGIKKFELWQHLYGFLKNKYF